MNYKYIYKYIYFLRKYLKLYFNKQDDICKILNQFRKGSELLSVYSRDGRLESKHRAHLVECLIEFYLKKGAGKITRDEFDYIAEQIVKQFPCEIKVGCNNKAIAL